MSAAEAATSINHQTKATESRPHVCPRTPQSGRSWDGAPQGGGQSGPSTPRPLSVPLVHPVWSPPVPHRHLLAEQLAAHTAPEPGACVGGPLAPGLLQLVQAAALQGLAHRLQATVGMRQDVGHAGGPTGPTGSHRGTGAPELSAERVRPERSAPTGQLLEPGREAHGEGGGSAFSSARSLSPEAAAGSGGLGPLLACWSWRRVRAPQTAGRAAPGGPRLHRRK